MAYYYEGLASCESDMRILSTLLDDCAHAEGMADDLGGDLTSLASATNGAILLGGPGSLTSAASTLGGGLCDAVRAIRQACESALSAVSSELYRFLGHGSPLPPCGMRGPRETRRQHGERGHLHRRMQVGARRPRHVVRRDGDGSGEGLGLHHETPQRRVKARRGRPDGKAPGKQEPDGVRELRRRVREPGRGNGSLRKASALFAASQAR